MSRKKPLAGPTISLFPFLAVLLCTMGGLLVLLVLFSRSARQGEALAAAGQQEQAAAELEAERDSLAWRREQLEEVRAKTAADLARARMQLAGVEESSRTLADELEKLERTATALVSSAGAIPADRETLQSLEARLTSARESLDKARKLRDTKPPAYAVVPFVGRAGTHRRPLYIECCGDGVFLQPEGIRLSPGDFEGPPGPGNPLASALRAAREHLAATAGAPGDPAAQPYPLLLVRPSGVMAYYAAREAIQSWGSDFGYQLVDEDWTLTFPPRDPTLAEVEKRAIAESRERLAWLAEVRPVRESRPARQYRAAPTRGGVVADGGPSVLGDQSRWDWAKSGKGSGGDTPGGQAQGQGGFDGGGESRGPARGTVAGGSGAGGWGGNGSAAAGDGPKAGMAGGATAGMPTVGGPAGGQIPGRDGAAALGDRYAGSSRFASGQPGDAGAPGSKPGETGGPGGAPTGTGAGVAGGVPSGTSTGSAAGAGATSAGTGGGTNAQGSAAGGGGGPALPGLAQTGAAGQPAQGGAASGSTSISFAQSRGKNWASLATQERPIPLTRPIRLECARDEFRLLDDGGRRVRTRIPVHGDTATAIDALVGAIHARVQDWGIAGDRMYWKPELVLSETSDGRSRREDLERLLAESGIDTRSVGADDLIRPLPPVARATGPVSGQRAVE